VFTSASHSAIKGQTRKHAVLQSHIIAGPRGVRRNAIKPYYGDATGDQLTGLLREHILIAADVVAAARAGDTARLNDQMAR